MAIKAKIIIDDKALNVLSFKLGFNQSSDTTGRPSVKAIFHGLSAVVEARIDVDITSWIVEENQGKLVVLEIHPRILGGRIRRIYFYDSHLVFLKTDFSSDGKFPLSEQLKINCAGVEDSTSSGVYTASWRETFPDETNEEDVVTREEEITPEIIDFYTSNKSGERIREYNIGDIIYVNIESQGKVGDVVTIDLTDKTKDFKYNGKTLENDSMDYEILSDMDKIKLEVIREGGD